MINIPKEACNKILKEQRKKNKMLGIQKGFTEVVEPGMEAFSSPYRVSMVNIKSKGERGNKAEARKYLKSARPMNQGCLL